jgi:hypothetical protein
MKITVAGSGAMGCRFGAALFQAGHDVVLLDGWREHVTAINAAGLRVTDTTGTRTLPMTAVLFSYPAPPPAAYPPPAPGRRPPPRPPLSRPRAARIRPRAAGHRRRRPGRPGDRVRQGDGHRGRGRRRERGRRDRAVHPGPHAAERPGQHRVPARPRARRPTAGRHDHARHRTTRTGAYPGARFGRDHARPAARRVPTRGDRDPRGRAGGARGGRDWDRDRDRGRERSSIRWRATS